MSHINPKNVETGDTVYLNDLDDAVAYRVTEVNGFAIEVKDGNARPQVIDRSYIVKATRNK